jgi:hypothetical protein
MEGTKEKKRLESSPFCGFVQNQVLSVLALTLSKSPTKRSSEYISSSHCLTMAFTIFSVSSLVTLGSFSPDRRWYGSKKSYRYLYAT